MTGTRPSDSARVARDRPFYGDLASAYDSLVDAPIEPWVEAVHAEVARRSMAPAEIFDAGCGTGRHAAGLSARGHRVDLGDASEALLAQAVRRCPDANAHLIDLCAVALDRRYDAVTCRGVLNDMITDAERDAALSSMAALLRPYGVLILDVRDAAASAARATGALRRKSVAIDDETTLTFSSTSVWDDGLLRVTEDYRLVGARELETTYEFTMRPWTADEIRRRLAASGLPTVTVRPGAGRDRGDRLFVVASR